MNSNYYYLKLINLFLRLLYCCPPTAKRGHWQVGGLQQEARTQNVAAGAAACTAAAGDRVPATETSSGRSFISMVRGTKFNN